MTWTLSKKEVFGVICYASLLPFTLYLESLEVAPFSVAIAGLILTLPFSPVAMLAGVSIEGLQRSLILTMLGCWLAMFFMAWLSLVQVKGIALQNDEKVSSVVVRVFRRSTVFVILVTAVAWWVISN